MSSSDRASRVQTVSFELTPAEQWTLHHVLLDRLHRGPGVGEIDAGPAASLRRAFDRLDAGTTSFTLDQLEALLALLAAYHHSSWVADRRRIERLLDRVTTQLVQHGRAPGVR